MGRARPQLAEDPAETGMVFGKDLGQHDHALQGLSLVLPLVLDFSDRLVDDMLDDLSKKLALVREIKIESGRRNTYSLCYVAKLGLIETVFKIQSHSGLDDLKPACGLAVNFHRGKF
jgi:hypothetical protein